MIRSKLVQLKNNNAFFYFLWSYQHYIKGILKLYFIKDKKAIFNLYKSFSGHIPDIENPVTFSEKLQWMKLYYHHSLMVSCAHKFNVRAYVEEKGYSSILSNYHTHLKSVKEFDLTKYPEKFVVKATHGSGWNLVCKNKNEINWFWWKKTFAIWLKNNIFWPGREWPYKDMKSSLIVEEYMEDHSGGLMDYKFHCFHGVPKYIQVNKGRGETEHIQNFYNTKWELQPFGKDLKPNADIKIEAPLKLSEMIKIAQDLSMPFPYVRVDFYEVNGKIIFGELTFYPKSGLPDFVPIEYDKIWGDNMNLANINKI